MPAHVDTHLIVIAIPFFFLLMGIEFAVSCIKRQPTFRLNDTLSDLSCGVGMQLIDLVIQIAVLSAYIFVYENARLLSIEMKTVFHWIFLLLAVDFLFYWYHRASHRINFLWATHIVHHQSEEFNLAVALRQPWFSALFSMFFYLPLAVLGFPPLATAGMIALDTVLQFWFHTRLIKRMGILEYFINTPSHHRVHHGRNPIYLDKNYGAFLIIWDKLFGTFQVEEEEPVYGIVKPLNSWNPLWSNFHYWFSLFEMNTQRRSLREKIGLWFGTPESLGGPAPKVAVTTVEKYDKNCRSRWLFLFIFIQFFLVIVSTVYILHNAPIVLAQRTTLMSGFVLWTIINTGALFEQKKWALPSEGIKWLLLIILLCFGFPAAPILAISI